jgi:acyl-CoA synthetase (AMP-forming)/AMP-acid ligase II/peptidoglycan/LPS O-acetylase OafA/YrhL
MATEKSAAGDERATWDWVHDLDRFGANPALISEDGPTLSYADLARRADEFAASLGAERRLVVLGVRNDIDSIVAYIGCLRGNHPVLLVAAGGDHARIFEQFRPDAQWDALTGALVLAPAPAGGLHPELAVLLSTSGSTGSPKLVRLSAHAVAANARSICDYLDIGPDERAITTLPFHYSYGMSVLNSHLMAGASVAVTELSVSHPGFERFLQAAQPTSLAGVPYTHELLARTGLVERLPPSVRTLTQAGGRLAPDRVRAIAQLGARRGFRFVPMYGQTEATARMAWLPPELAEQHPDCIGRPIPGGSFRLEDAEGRAIREARVAGELVYRGPNVMMGYATARADLDRGAELDELRTGDIAERTGDGLYRIVGRASRFAKIAGLRIGFDDVEALLRAEGLEAVVTGSDLLVAIQLEGADAGLLARAAVLVAERARIPEANVVAIGGAVPRLPTGKVDYGAILREAGQQAAARDRQLGEGVHPILAGYRRAFNRPDLGVERSFQELGGDSLAFVNAAIAIEKALGMLPAGWEEMPVSALIALAAGPAPAQGRGRWTALGTDTLVRVCALALVIIGHAAPAHTLWLRGGAGVLMVLAGFSFARFQRTSFERGATAPVLRGTFERLILPYYVVMVPMLIASEAQRSWGWFALVSVFTVQYRGPLFAFWFIETVFHALLLMAVLYALPGVRRWSARNPFGMGLALFALALAMLVLVPMTALGEGDVWKHRLHHHFWLYALGFLAAVARGRERLIVLGLGLVAGALILGVPAPRALWLAAGLAMILFVPAVGVPARIAGPLLRIAAASYFIYVVHVPLHHLLHFELGLRDKPLLNVPMLLLSSIGFGLLFETLWSRLVLFVRDSRARGRGSA